MLATPGNNTLPNVSTVPTKMAASIAGLKRASASTIYVPGHGPVSTFGDERATNPYVADRLFANEGTS